MIKKRVNSKPLTLCIIIPVYNEEDYLFGCLDSIAKQSKLPDDVVVVANNSTDNSVSIAETYPFVRVVKEKKQGSVYASYAGMQSSKCDILARIDADTLLDKDWSRELLKLFNDNPGVAGYGGQCRFYNIPLARLVGKLHHLVYHRLQAMVAGCEVMWGSNMAIRSVAWKQIKNDVHLYNYIDEDIDVSLCLKKQNLSIALSDKIKAGVAMRRPNSLTVLKTFSYLSTWPKDYYANGLWFRGLLIHLMTIIACVGVFLPLVVYQFLYALNPGYFGRLITASRNP